MPCGHRMDSLNFVAHGTAIRRCSNERHLPVPLEQCLAIREAPGVTRSRPGTPHRLPDRLTVQDQQGIARAFNVEGVTQKVLAD